MKLTIEACEAEGYRARTAVNAKSADVTIAIAIKFDSAGEKLTKTLVTQNKKLYIAISPIGDIQEKANKTVALLNKTFDSKQQTITLNIAGNGIYTMKGVMTQNECDKFTHSLLAHIISNQDFKLRITEIRSGGQTGFDEAGIKAGIRLGINTTAFYPKDFRIRDLHSDRTQTMEQVLKHLTTNL